MVSGQKLVLTLWCRALIYLCPPPWESIPDQHPVPTGCTRTVIEVPRPGWEDTGRVLSYYSKPRLPLTTEVVGLADAHHTQYSPPCPHPKHHNPCPHGLQSPQSSKPAPTLRAETVGSSRSGELAIILWAAKMPEGTEFLLRLLLALLPSFPGRSVYAPEVRKSSSPHHA